MQMISRREIKWMAQSFFNAAFYGSRLRSEHASSKTTLSKKGHQVQQSLEKNTLYNLINDVV